MQKYYRTTVVVTILSNEPVNDGYDLEGIAWEMSQGAFSGVTDIQPSIEITKDQMKKELLNQGSDPEFLISDKSET